MNLRDVLHKSSRRTFPIVDQPTVSIIIPVWNRPKQVEVCLRSIIASTPPIYEVIVVDNNTEKPTKDVLKSFHNMHIITNTDNLWFVDGCNQGAQSARGTHVLFLNDDTQVTHGWLEALLRTMKQYPRCGAVGGKLIQTTQTLQEAGSIIWNDGSTCAYGRGEDPAASCFAHVREVDYCSGACLLVNRALFESVGKFDRCFAPAYYEDVDVCMAVREQGYTVMYQPECVVLHDEFGGESSTKAVKLMQKNRVIFLKKWRQVLCTYHHPDVRNILSAREHGAHVRVLYIDDRVPSPDAGMGYPRAYAMLCMLADLGFRVTLYPLNDKTEYPSTQLLRQRGIEVVLDAPSFTKMIAQRGALYECIIVSRPPNFAHVRSLLKRYSGKARILYDAEAIFADRERLRQDIHPHPFSRLRSMLDRRRELILAEKADDVICVSKQDFETFASIKGKDHTHIWGHPLVLTSSLPSYEQRSDVLFVGGGIQPGFPNEDALLYFVRDILPIVHRHIACTFTIVGRIESPAVQALASDSVRFTGFVESVVPYYERARVFVAPTRFAAGIPWKVHEAMAHGVPCAISHLLSQQLGAPEPVALAADSPEGFAQNIIDLYSDANLWLETQKAATRYIQEHCNPESMQVALQRIIAIPPH